jgi:uncharacterized RDD family membrane protein YckC
MHCNHCGFRNGEDDHRCLRCGRRLSGIVIAAPPGYSGANALAPAVVSVVEKKADPREYPPVQNPLFRSPSPNVIPFDRASRRAAAESPRIVLPVNVLPVNLAPRVPARKSSPPANNQGTLDFIPAPVKARRLRTDAEAQIFCDRAVATPMHRFVASAIDAATILLGFGLLVMTVQLLGGNFGSGKMFWIGLGAALALVSMLYGFIWAIAGRETAGMRFTDLQLISFDGFPLDPRSRALRFASTWLSFCSGGLGLLWAIADEENLTWHDHISKTFPTIRDAPGAFVKQRR